MSSSGAERGEVRVRARTAGPRPRDRLELIRLADAGWAVPRIARRLGRPEQTVRRHITAFLAEGFAALSDRPRSGRPPRGTEAALLALAAVRDAGGRTWTTRQVVAWLAAARGVTVHPDQRRRLPRRRRFGRKRTTLSVAHKRRDPDGYDATVADLAGLEHKRRRG